jgi:hypothetical protein
MNLNVGNPETGKVYFMQLVGSVGGGIGDPVPELSGPSVGAGSVLIAGEPASTNITR